MGFIVDVKDNCKLSAEEPLRGQDVLAVCGKKGESNIVAWRVNNYLRPLDWIVDDDCFVEFVDTSSFEGMEVYRRSLSFLLVLASKYALSEDVFIRHSISDGYYCELESGEVSEEKVQTIKTELDRLVSANIPIKREVLSGDKARRIFTRQGNFDKANLLRWAAVDPIEVYKCDGTYGYYYAPLAPSTGYMKIYDLIPYDRGMVLRFPTVAYPQGLPPFMPSKRLAEVFAVYAKWLDILGINTMEGLHALVSKGKSNDIIQISEALHSQWLSRLVEIVASKQSIRLICIAGPSASGKTTTAQRLRIQLQVFGKRSFIVSLDDYFVEREKTPRDEKGNYDFEALEALDLNLINDDLVRLIGGEEVEMPRFNFFTGKRERGPTLRLGKEDILIVEGIHGLNELVTQSVPEEQKWRLYVSPLTGINLDRHNRTSTTDNRLIRRLVRDNRTRGKTPEATLLQWPSVIRGAQRHIFPYQERAHAMFNSATVYELAVLKGYVEPLLRNVHEDSPMFGEAQRLLTFLHYIPFMPADEVPNNSIIREFIGGSCFESI